jgi:hypothetical protein
MAFALARGKSIGDELQRLLDRQLRGALDALRASPPKVHAARRRIKRARAVLSAARPGLAQYRAIAEELRRANHLLGALTDADTVIGTLDAMRGFDRSLLPDSQIAQLRVTLSTAAARLNDGAAAVRGHAARIIARQRDALAGFDAAACGMHSTAAAVRRAHRNARMARKHALAHPTTAAFHAWRRRTKIEWHLLRLLDAVVGGRLVDDERRLEQLDGCLGELHDLAVLQEHVLQHSPLARPQTARALRAMRARAGDLRRRARLLAGALDEPPRELDMRILSLWTAWRPRVDADEGEAWRSRA